MSSVSAATLGAPRIGRRRELKFALEAYWAGKSSAEELQATAKALRAANWREQQARGIAKIPSNDFSLYDQVLDAAVMLGAIPKAYGWKGGAPALELYFAMARGSQKDLHAEACGCGSAHEGGGVPAMEMTKWFDTNYHYLAPEFAPDQEFALTSLKPVEEFLEAKALGIQTRPVILGPLTFLKIGKAQAEGFEPLTLLPKLLPVYEALLAKLAEAGADWVQIDEPALVLDLTEAERGLYILAYDRLTRAAPGLKILVASYFGALGENLETATALPVAGLHADLVRAPEQLEPLLARARKDQLLSLGLIDGRNVWRADLPQILARIRPLIADRPKDLIEIAASCSLLHTPVDLDLETALDPEVKSWLAFALQKMEELAVLAKALNQGDEAVKPALEASARAAAARKASPKIHDAKVSARLAEALKAKPARQSPFAARRKLQAEAFRLPAFPTTTIGSFPQTAEVRKARAAYGRGEITEAAYEAFLREETAKAVRWQEEIGLDVLVHGEFERNDMVQYFGEKLAGFAFTKHAWVQSYGSRCVRPPILYGDVSRPAPMTLDWWRYAQSLTTKPMKGMLTGPATILNWSFLRDDLPRETVCRQIALAIRDEVQDLEAAGARMIQIDEAALREGLPLRKADQAAYLGWAVESFRLASAGVADATQIHTHMCYSEFNEILGAIAAMDADVISIETSRSKMELLEAFRGAGYPNEIGPGVYDIHSPRVPAVGEMAELLRLARQRLAEDQLWVNPDCGLKTRKWEETRPALVNMVAAAKMLRAA